MTIKHVTLNSIVPAQSTIVNGVVIDGYVDGQPMQFVRTADNRVKPAIGTTVHTPYGSGPVTRYSSTNRVVVAISQFNENFEFINADESDIYDAEEFVYRAARSMNVGVESNRETFMRLYKGEITGLLSKTNEKKMLATFPSFASNEVVDDGSNKRLAPSDMVVARIIKDSRETPAERKARIRRERALATKMANAMLSGQADDSNDAVPADVLAEMNEIYGD